MNTKHWMITLVLLLSLLGCGKAPVVKEEVIEGPGIKEEQTPLPPPVTTRLTILADGFVQTTQPALPLAFETGGKLVEIHVQAGDQVQAGDLIASLFSTSITRVELNVVQAQQNLDALYENADLEAAAALIAMEEAGKAMEDLLDTDLEVAAAWQTVVEAEDALAVAQRNVYIAQSTAGPADIDAAFASLLLAEDELASRQEAFDALANLPADNLRRATAQAALSAAQQNYDRAVQTYNALTSTLDSEAQAVAEARLATARAQLLQAQRDWERVKDGPSAGTIARAEAELAAAQARWDLLQNGPDPEAVALAESELSLAQAEAEATQSELLTPWAGTVLSVEASPGTLIGGGTPIVTLLDLTQLEFHTTNLSERDLGQIQAGQAAVVTLKAYPNEALEAVVVRVGLLAGDPVGDAVTFPVILLLGESDLDIRPGMTGRVEILSGE